MSTPSSKEFPKLYPTFTQRLYSLCINTKASSQGYNSHAVHISGLSHGFPLLWSCWRERYASGEFEAAICTLSWMGKWTSNWRVWRAEWTTPIYTRSQAPLARQEEGDEGKDEDVSGELSNCILPRAKPLLSASLTKSRRGRLLLPSVPKVSMCLRWCVDLWSRTLSTLPTACIYNSCLDIEEVARARPLANKPSTHLCRNKCITLLGLRQFLKWTVFLWAISWGPCPVWWSCLSTLADGGLEYKLSRVSPVCLGQVWMICDVSLGDHGSGHF